MNISKEDIESLGWKFLIEQPVSYGLTCMAFKTNKDIKINPLSIEMTGNYHYTLEYISSQKVIIQEVLTKNEKVKANIVYEGRLPDKNALKQLMEWLEINNNNE